MTGRTWLSFREPAACTWGRTDLPVAEARAVIGQRQITRDLHAQSGAVSRRRWDRRITLRWGPFFATDHEIKPRSGGGHGLIREARKLTDETDSGDWRHHVGSRRRSNRGRRGFDCRNQRYSCAPKIRRSGPPISGSARSAFRARRGIEAHIYG